VRHIGDGQDFPEYSLGWATTGRISTWWTATASRWRRSGADTKRFRISRRNFLDALEQRNTELMVAGLGAVVVLRRLPSGGRV